MVLCEALFCFEICFFFIQALEVCVDSIESALNAWEGGAKRIELCSALSLGGLTPSVGQLCIIKKLIPECIVFVMIRIKPGEDYVYTEYEIDAMCDDINILKDNGADGFVFGCLNLDKSVNEKACAKLLQSAKNYPCTFHRAFDVVDDAEKALNLIINLGFSRILTSGQEKSAYIGMGMIRKLVAMVKENNSKLIIIAGGGLNVKNLKEVLETTCVKEFHGSARSDNDENLQNSVACKSIVQAMIQIAQTL